MTRRTFFQKLAQAAGALAIIPFVAKKKDPPPPSEPDPRVRNLPKLMNIEIIYCSDIQMWLKYRTFAYDNGYISQSIQLANASCHSTALRHL